MCGVSVSWKGGMKMKLIGRKILSFVKLGVKNWGVGVYGGKNKTTKVRYDSHFIHKDLSPFVSK